MNNQKITRAIAHGIKFVLKNQSSDGGFGNTTFLPSIIAISMHRLNNPKSKTILKKISKFLRGKSNSSATFNYWSKPDDHLKNERYPDDWDDTALAHSARIACGLPIAGSDLAKIIHNLRKNQLKAGGPFSTWITNTEKAFEFDIAVNANIAYFLSLHKARPNNLYQYLHQKIETNQLSSPYYYSKLSVLYFLSRIIDSSKHQKLLVKYLLLLQSKNPLDTAFKVCALLNLDYPVNKLKSSIKSILNQQESDHGWKWEALGIEKISGNTTHYSGNRALTSAICIEALDLYLQKTSQNDLDISEKCIYTNSIKAFQKHLNTYPKTVQQALIKNTQRVLTDSEKYQIILLPFWFASLSKNKISNKILICLAEANIWGWVTYRLYDDILDSKDKAPALPLANIAFLRLTELYFNSTITNYSAQKLFRQTIKTIEIANFRESIYMKSGNEEHLSDKSLGAALPALTILLLTGYSVSSVEYKTTTKFFRHYLTLRQINDDAHDWQDDLENGTTNFVAQLFEHKNRTPKVFWQDIHPKIIKLCAQHLKLAREALKQLPASKYKPRLIEMLKSLSESLQQSKQQHKQTIDFINHY